MATGENDEPLSLEQRVHVLDNDVNTIVRHFNKALRRIRKLEKTVRSLQDSQPDAKVLKTLQHKRFWQNATVRLGANGELSVSSPPCLPLEYEEVLEMLGVNRVPYEWNGSRFYYLEFREGVTSICQNWKTAASYEFAAKVKQFLQLPHEQQVDIDNLPASFSMFKSNTALLCGRLRCLLAYSYDVAKITKTRTRINEDRTPSAQRMLGIETVIDGQKSEFMRQLLLWAVEESSLLLEQLFTKQERESAFHMVSKPMKDTDNYNTKNCLLQPLFEKKKKNGIKQQEKQQNRAKQSKEKKKKRKWNEEEKVEEKEKVERKEKVEDRVQENRHSNTSKRRKTSATSSTSTIEDNSKSIVDGIVDSVQKDRIRVQKTSFEVDLNNTAKQQVQTQKKVQHKRRLPKMMSEKQRRKATQQLLANKQGGHQEEELSSPILHNVELSSSKKSGKNVKEQKDKKQQVDNSSSQQTRLSWTQAPPVKGLPLVSYSSGEDDDEDFGATSHKSQWDKSDDDDGEEYGAALMKAVQDDKQLHS